ncbi:guanylate kinase [Ferrovum sp.]|uniref:guanylate kinase n=1 Tax=Ferrovum sp. TaxID=2609467 RepID=UPI00260A10D2|nr:guanylate kinase [Ferrovum sp.]
MKNRMIVTLTGPSCAGKSTLEAMLNERGFRSVISTTTRPMRAGEVDGKNYYFVDADKFARLNADGKFVEYVNFNGHHYGVTEMEIEASFSKGESVVIVVDPSGQHQIKRFAQSKGWIVYSVFVTNPATIIAKRFMERFTCDMASRSAKDSSKQLEVVKTHSARLGAMMTEERDWIVQAATTGRYDMFMTRFDEMNSDSVVDEIIKRARLREAA